MKFIRVFLLVCISTRLYSQFGCPDPQAINYNNQATINDGSCQYAATNYTLQWKDTLGNALSEISGMVYWNGKLYAHNDSGSPAILFELDTSNGNITKEIFLQGIAAVDWEDITQDATHFYIGDVGNNAGDRTDLEVLKFPKSALGANYYDTIPYNLIEIIAFSYPDQINFAPAQNATPFDCEALAFRDNQLHLFTKNWTLGPCVHYVIPNTVGIHIAQRIDSLNTQGVLITGADFAPNRQLMLSGYKNTGTAEVSFWYIYDFNQSDSFFVSGNKRKIVLGDALGLGQVEGVCFVDTALGFVSNERFNPIPQINIPQQLYQFGTAGWYPYQFATSFVEVQNVESDFNVISGKQKMDIYFNSIDNQTVKLILYSPKGKKLREKSYVLSQGRQKIVLDNLDLASGIYYVLLSNQKGVMKASKVFFQNR